MAPKLGDITIPSEKNIQYTVGRKLGEGQYGEVYLAESPEDIGDFHDVGAYSIKFVMGDPEDAILRVRHEFDLMDRAGCSHVVEAVDYSDNPEQPFIVMEYVPETLLGISRKGTMNQLVAMRYVEQVPQMLAYFLKKGIIHLDLKGSNIGYGSHRVGEEVDVNDPDDGVIVALDFGLAVPLNFKRVRHRGTAELLPHCAPEFVETGEINATTDTYGAGKVLDFMLTGTFSDSPSDFATGVKTYHDVKAPTSLVALYAAMTNQEPDRRWLPGELQRLADAVVLDLRGKNLLFNQDRVQMGTLADLVDPLATLSSLLE